MTTYQLAEQYHAGSPIALYNMQPWWIHFYQVIRRILLGTVICAMLFIIVMVALFFYQYLVVFGSQIPDLQERLILSLPGIVIGLLGCGACLIFRNIIAQKVPASFLVCTDGLLEIHPKQVDVTRWDEMRGPLQELGLGKRKSYKLYRKNREPLVFGETFEGIESLVDLIKQQFLKEQQ